MLGSGINPTAGVEVARIEVKLADCEGNPITRDRDIDDLTGELAVIPGKDEECYGNNDNCDPQPVNLTWTNCNAENVCQLFATYTPIGSTISGARREWSIDLTINGETGSKGLPSIRPNYWDPASSGPVTEGMQYFAYCVSTDPAEFAYFGKLLSAGVEVRCLIQSRDAYNNDRIADNSGEPETPDPAKTIYTVDVECGLANTAGSECVENDQATMTYAYGDGRYFLTFTPQRTSTEPKQLRLTLTGDNGGGAEEVVVLEYTVLPGEPAPESILARSATTTVLENSYNSVDLSTVTVDASDMGPDISCTNGDCEFVIVSLDRFGNMRKPLFNGAPTVTDWDDYKVNLVTFLDPPQLGEIKIVMIVDGIFYYQFSQTSPTAFYMIVAKTNQGASITNSEWGLTIPSTEAIRLDPGDPFGPQTIYDGPGLIGCISGSEASFQMTPLDMWGNSMIDFDDNADFEVSIYRNGQPLSTGTVTNNPLQNENHLLTAQRYDVTLSYEVTYTCPPAGNFELYLSLDNPTTNDALCGDWAGLTGCNDPKFSRACTDTQTLGQCGFFKVFELEGVANVQLTYAILESYKFDPSFIGGASTSKSLLSIGRTTHPYNQQGTVNWWYIQDLDGSGNPSNTPPTGSFTVLLTAENGVDKITIPSTDIIQVDGDLSKWWVRFTPKLAGVFTAKIFYRGIFQTGANNDWESDPFEITLGEVSPRNSNVEWVQNSVSAGVEGSFLVQLVDKQNNIHPHTAPNPYCPRIWSTTGTNVVDQNSVNCDEVRAEFSLQGQAPSSVDCAPTTDNKWECKYTLTAAGEYNVKVFSQVDDPDQSEIDSSTGFSLTVVAGPPSASTSYLAPASAGATFVAGAASFVDLVLLDEFLNPAVVPASFGDNFGLTWENPGTGVGVWVSAESSVTLGSIAWISMTHKLIDPSTRSYDQNRNEWLDGSNDIFFWCYSCYWRS